MSLPISFVLAHWVSQGVLLSLISWRVQVLEDHYPVERLKGIRSLDVSRLLLPQAHTGHIHLLIKLMLVGVSTVCSWWNSSSSVSRMPVFISARSTSSSIWCSQELPFRRVLAWVGVHLHSRKWAAACEGSYLFPVFDYRCFHLDLRRSRLHLFILFMILKNCSHNKDLFRGFVNIMRGLNPWELIC